jgi:hypothetical protein
VNTTDGDRTGTRGDRVRAGVLSAAVFGGPDMWWWVSRVMSWLAWASVGASVLAALTVGLGWAAWAWWAVGALLGVAGFAARGLAHAACRREFTDDASDDLGEDEGGEHAAETGTT